MKELVLTDRPLRHRQSMKGMNEQPDLIVLTLGVGRQKYMRIPLKEKKKRASF